MFTGMNTALSCTRQVVNPVNSAAVPIQMSTPGPAWLQQQVPAIGKMLVDFVQTNALTSPGRVAAFNELAGTGFQGQQFGTLLSVVLMTVVGELSKYQAQQQSQMLPTVVNSVIQAVYNAYVGDVLARNFQYYTQENPGLAAKQAEIVNTRNLWLQYVNNAKSVSDRMAMQSMPQQMGMQQVGGMGIGMNGMQNMAVQSNGFQQANGYASMFSAMNTAVDTTPDPAQVTLMEAAKAVVQEAVQVVTGGQTAAPAQPMTAFDAAVLEQPFNNAPSQPAVVKEDIVSNGVTFKNFNARFAPLLAWNHNISVQRFVALDITDKNGAPYAKQVIEYLPMDEQQHRVPNFIDGRYYEIAVNNSDEPLALRPSDQKPVLLIKDVISSQIVSQSLRQSCTDMRSALNKRLEAGEGVNAVSAHFFKFSPILPGTLHEPELFKTIAENSGDLNMVHQLLKNCKTSDFPIRDTFIKRLDEYFTTYINDVMRRNLSMTVTISSFLEDWADLKEYIFTNYNSVFWEKLINPVYSSYKTDIMMSGQLYDMMIKALLDNGDEFDKDHVLFVLNNYVAVAVTLNSWEFGISLNEGVGNVLTEEASPYLYNLVRELFIDKEGDEHNYTTLVIETADGHIFKVGRSPTSSGSFMIEHV